MGNEVLVLMRFALIFLALTSTVLPAGSQSTESQRESAQRLRAARFDDQVVRVLPQTSKGNSTNEGFGLIVGTKGTDLYVVTPNHVVFDRDHQLTDRPHLRFRSTPETDVTAERLDAPNASPPNYDDLAVLVVRDAADRAPKAAAPIVAPDALRGGEWVWSIGRAESWDVSGVHGGFVKRIIDPTRLVFDSLPTPPGSSGAAIVMPEGIVAMVTSDADAFETRAVAMTTLTAHLHDWDIPFDRLVSEPPPPPVEDERIVNAVRDCNLLAASPLDPNRAFGIPGVELDKLDADKAVQACLTALGFHPDDPSIAFELGRAYQRKGTSPESREALRLYKKSANLGFAPAFDNIGRMYRDGDGIPKDEVEAVSWFRKGADAQYFVALDDLGKMYAEGRGGLDKDDREAMRLYNASEAITNDYEPVKNDISKLLSSVKSRIATSNDRDELKVIGRDFPKLSGEVDVRIAQLDEEDRLNTAQMRIAASNDRDDIRKIANNYPTLKGAADARIAQLDEEDRLDAAQKSIVAANDPDEIRKIANDYPSLKGAADARISQLEYADKLSAAEKRIAVTNSADELKEIGATFPSLKVEVDTRIAKLDEEDRLDAAQKSIVAANDPDEIRKIANDYPSLKGAADARIAQLEYADKLAAAQQRIAAANDPEEIRKIGSDYPSLKGAADARIVQLEYADKLLAAQKRIASSNNTDEIRKILADFPDLQSAADARIILLKNAQILNATQKLIAISTDRNELELLANADPDLKGEVNARIAQLDYKDRLADAQKRIVLLDDRDDLKGIAVNFPSLKVEVDARIAQLDEQERLGTAQKRIAVSNDRDEIGKIANDYPRLKGAADARIAQLEEEERLNAAQNRIAAANDPDEIRKISRDYPSLNGAAEARISQLEYADKLAAAQKRVSVINNIDELTAIETNFPTLKVEVEARIAQVNEAERLIKAQKRIPMSDDREELKAIASSFPPLRDAVAERIAQLDYSADGVIGYVIFGLIDTANTLNPSYFTIDGADKSRLPSRGDVISRKSLGAFSVRAVPFHWDSVQNNYVVQSDPPVVKTDPGDKLRVAGDVFITLDPKRTDHKLYVVAPISEFLGREIEPSPDVFSHPVPLPGVLGYVNIGLTGDDMSSLTEQSFKNISRPTAIYPAPNDIMVADTPANVRIGPRHWNKRTRIYENPPSVPNVSINQGDRIKVGGDVIMSTQGHSIWAPITDIYRK
ncbi:trypsin-like peptidase domain-containing protein [Labrys okinawensis]|uniref:trypsin-like peptidase domain-containing protein n=1 Tax=Labrys okinawensis TaxID=346911 RepID=UPI0039BD62D0